MTLFDTSLRNASTGKHWQRSGRALVAGGAGFLGSHLCERLINSGYWVVCLDNFSTGKLANIEHLFVHPRFSLVSHDVVERINLEGPFDQIFNLACPASPRHYQSNPLHTMNTCYLGTANLLELARATGARFLQASTSEVYGDPEVSPQSENYRGCVNTFGPRSCYDEGKRVAETLCYEYASAYGVAVRVVRIFNTYGPRMDPGDGRVVSNFVVQALRGQDLTVYGSGNQTRSFCYVDDLIEGFMRLIASDVCKPINIGNPGEFTINELAEKVVALTGAKVQMMTQDLPVDDPRQRKPDITLARELLGWAPQVELEEGLVRTINWMRNQITTVPQESVRVVA